MTKSRRGGQARLVGRTAAEAQAHQLLCRMLDQLAEELCVPPVPDGVANVRVELFLFGAEAAARITIFRTDGCEDVKIDLACTTANTQEQIRAVVKMEAERVRSRLRVFGR